MFVLQVGSGTSCSAGSAKIIICMSTHPGCLRVDHPAPPRGERWKATRAEDSLLSHLSKDQTVPVRIVQLLRCVSKLLGTLLGACLPVTQPT